MNRIHKIFIVFIPLLLGLFALGQQTTLKGQVLDGMNKQPLPFAKIQFYNSKIGTVTDSLGNFYLQTYYATDSIKVSFSGYISKTVKIQKDKEQELVIELNILSGTLNEVRLKAPDEMPSTRLHKRVIANKSINNKEKLEFQLEHNTQVGALGRMRYGMTAGYIFGNTAYPFLKVHEGNQSLWLLTTAFNKMNFLEFISDRYIMAFSENHWEGLLFDRLPGIKKLKLRLVTNVRAVYGDISDRHQEEMIKPDFVRRFGNIPYVETALGIENIAKFLRVDLVYRATHQIPNVSPLGILFRLDLYF